VAKLWVISDFQGDINGAEGFFNPEYIPDADVLVVAGDFCPPLCRSVLALSKISFRMPVIYVPGNRDYYTRNTIEAELELARAAARAPQGKGLHVLDGDVVEVAGTRFVGATLWTDLAFDGGPKDKALSRLNDFLNITTDDGPFTPAEYRRRHVASRRVIEDVIAVPFNGPTVVVSHHSPHANSVGERYAGNVDGVNALFHSDLSEILEGSNAPDVWVHGATHVGVDYRVGRTRVLSNPLGYGRGAENPGFLPDLVVDPREVAYLPAY
jgi:predicted phosphodiesterase